MRRRRIIIKRRVDGVEIDASTRRRAFGQVRRDAVAQAWRRVIRKEQSMLIALAAARTASGHLVVELVMPFVAGRRLGDAPFYAY